MMPAALIYALSSEETRTAFKRAADRHAALEAARPSRRTRRARGASPGE
jgi:hypothetical protein